ncbi:MAG: hypothetical protein CM1200mP2_56120 [Planctomycetaceae bacterium]|nr:MAG: hypothetical protein CM1200mP2_56120 [Planctomycetaceae bacterium]
MYAYNLACVYSRAIEMINKDPNCPPHNRLATCRKKPSNSSKRPSSTAGGTRPG